VSGFPSLDVHAHIDIDIDPEELSTLGVIFAATRSLDEADTATQRHDKHTVWGVGCHPGLVGAHKAFDEARFAHLITRTAFVSEVGLDGKSRVPLSTQQATLDAVLAVLQKAPRITSLHSYQATEEVIEALKRRPIVGAILHWWLGDATQTRRAIDLGCYFSVNASSVRRTDLLRIIPADRLLTETDHPFGDRRGGESARPGSVNTVERDIALLLGMPATAVRGVMWANLAQIVGQTGCGQLLPPKVRRQLLAS
jgi:TatD DNase family protein